MNRRFDPVVDAFQRAVVFNVKRRRRALKITCRKLAYLTGLSFRHLMHFEEHSKFVSFEALTRIAIALRCLVADLVPRPPTVEVVRPKRSKDISENGRVVRIATSRRGLMHRRMKERGYPLSREECIARARAAMEKKKKASKIRSRSEMKRKKACSVQENARVVQKK